MVRQAGDWRRAMSAVAAGVAAIPLGLAPRRLWHRLPGFPFAAMAPVSGILTAVAGLAIGWVSFFDYLQRTARAVPPGAGREFGMVLLLISVLAFVALTPAGWLSKVLRRSVRYQLPRLERNPAHSCMVVFALLIWTVVQTGCGGGATGPSAGPLPNGRWTGGGACLAVTDSGCNLVVGCGHGRFAKPIIRPDGTFDVDGTYRIEIGPVSIEPAPPAHFSGSVAGSSITLTVVPTAPSLQPATYLLQPTTPGVCLVPCV